jgi:CSLREA domain-containing protein
MSHSGSMHPYSKGLRLVAITVMVTGLMLVSRSTPMAYAATISVTTTVDELSNNGTCSLREAIIAANMDTAVDTCPAGVGADTITLPAGTYTLSIAGQSEDAAATGDLDITSAMTLIGANKNTTIIDGGRLDRIFDTHGAVKVIIKQVTIRNGSPASGEAGGGVQSNGSKLTVSNSIITGNSGYAAGGINTSGGTLQVNSSTISSNTANFGCGGGIATDKTTATVTNSTISNNTAPGAGSCGGGIMSGGSLTVKTSTINGNTANTGGGIASHAPLTVSGSTISGNSVNISGGGIDINGIYPVKAMILTSTISGNTAHDDGGVHNLAGDTMVINSTISGNSVPGIAGGIYNEAKLTLQNVTITGNAAGSSNQGFGGGIVTRNDIGSTTSRNTIIAGNIDRNGTDPDCTGPLVSQGYNLIQSNPFNHCLISGDTATNLLGVDPLLGTLKKNGGKTMTHALLSGSPAIDAGNPAVPGSGGYACERTDQRAVTRPTDGDGNGSARCDIGAVERKSVSTP